MQSLAEIRTEILRLKWHVAAWHFRRALHRHALALKAGFDPEQPRDELGRWVDTERGEEGRAEDSDEAEGGSGEEVTEFSDVRRPRPPMEVPGDIPKVRPETIQEVNRIAREVSRNPYLGTYYIISAAEFTAHWLGEKYWEIRADQDPPKSLEELRDAVSRSDRRGYDEHHIVEQTAARKQGFPESQISEPDNRVLIPRYKHEQINSWYQTSNKDFDGKTPRQYLTGKGWDEHRAVGLRAMREFGVLKP
jgi:hypothetical protein